MTKKVHLICNAHLDPVWQWGWEEGSFSHDIYASSADPVTKELS